MPLHARVLRFGKQTSQIDPTKGAHFIVVCVCVCACFLSFFCTLKKLSKVSNMQKCSAHCPKLQKRACEVSMNLLPLRLPAEWLMLLNPSR